MYLKIPQLNRYLKWEIIFLPMSIRNGTELQENQPHKMVREEGERSPLA